MLHVFRTQAESFENPSIQVSELKSQNVGKGPQARVVRDAVPESVLGALRVEVVD